MKYNNTPTSPMGLVTYALNGPEGTYIVNVMQIEEKGILL
jgi:hypothetical protein